MRKNFKFLLFQIIFFTLMSQFFSTYAASKFIFTPVAEEVYEPFGSTPEAAVANSIPIIISVFLFGSLIALFVKWKKFNLMKAIFTGLLMGIGFSLNSTLFSSIQSELFWPAGIIFVIFIFLANYFEKFYFLSKPLSLFIAAEVAGYFATILRPPTVFVLPLLLALYDIYAVFRGPLRKIIGKPPKRRMYTKSKIDFLSLLIVDFGFVKIGLGDIIFYSLLPSVGFVYYGIEKMFLCIVLTNIGVFLTLYLLFKKKTPLPGLPIPIFLGVLAFLF